jgi:hypothetical protein
VTTWLPVGSDFVTACRLLVSTLETAWPPVGFRLRHNSVGCVTSPRSHLANRWFRFPHEVMAAPSPTGRREANSSSLLHWPTHDKASKVGLGTDESLRHSTEETVWDSGYRTQPCHPANCHFKPLALKEISISSLRT